MPHYMHACTHLQAERCGQEVEEELYVRLTHLLSLPHSAIPEYSFKSYHLVSEKIGFGVSSTQRVLFTRPSLLSIGPGLNLGC